MRVLLVGGGSLGHVAPNVAVARALRMMSATIDVHIVCSDREEEMLFLREEELPFSTLPILRRTWKLPLQSIHVLRRAGYILQHFNPHAIFSKGSGLSVPLCFLAHRKKIPIVIHESDAVMGNANRIVSRWSSVICRGFPLHENNRNSKFEIRNSIFTGNPVRSAVTQGSREEALKLTKLSGNKPILLVLGGSQGSSALNETILKHLDHLLEHVEIIHLTGIGKESDVKCDGYWSAPFAHGSLAHFYAAADMALSRAGAGAIAELAANGIPTILVPLRGVGHDHQFANAKEAARSRGCIHLEQDHLARELPALIEDLARHEEKRRAMQERIQTLSCPDAAEHIARIVREVAEKSSGIR